MISKDKLLRQNEALKIENSKLKLQLNGMMLEKAMEEFEKLSDYERNAVEICYQYIGENYDGGIVWEDFVAQYIRQRREPDLEVERILFSPKLKDLPF